MSGREGMVYLVGAGPGDPGLITVRGRDALATCDVVVHDQLSNPRLLDLAPAGALRIFAGKGRDRCPVPQDQINDLLVAHARAGRAVVRLKGGDPFVFGRGAEEAEHLHRAGVAFEVIPGVTAGVGAAAAAGIPLTHRDDASAVAFLTGHSDPDHHPGRYDWPVLARFPGTLVFYMGHRHHAAILGKLIEHGLAPSTPAALVQSGSLPAQRVAEGTAADLPAAAVAKGIGSPALLIVGRVARRRAALDRSGRLPLAGQRIVVTRPADSGESSAADLERLGAEVLLAPMVEVRPVDDPGPIDRAIARVEAFDWIVFTSPNGVAHLLDRVEQLGKDLRVFGGARFAAIGPGTAARLRDYRLRADLVASVHRSEGLAEELGERVAGRRVLLARADRGRTVLADRLAPVAHVEQIAVYANADASSLPSEVAERLDAGSIDWVALTSSAGAGRLHALAPQGAHRRIRDGSIRLACLSPVTGDAVRRLGWPVAVEAPDSTWRGLVDALVSASAPRRGPA